MAAQKNANAEPATLAETPKSEGNPPPQKKAPKAPAKKQTKAEKKPPYYVAKGRAITTKVGVLSGDVEAEVKAEHLSGGEETLNHLVEKGYVIKS